MEKGFHGWELRSGFQRRLQDVSFRTVVAILFWSLFTSCMLPQILATATVVPSLAPAVYSSLVHSAGVSQLLPDAGSFPS